MLTKGAIGNLINRYRAVLTKCRLRNVFGSLAVAGMLVMGGAGSAAATIDWGKDTTVNITTGPETVSAVPGREVESGTHFSNTPVESLTIGGSGSLTLQTGGRLINYSYGGASTDGMDVTMNDGQLTITGSSGGFTSIDANTVTINGGTVTITGDASGTDLGYLGAYRGLIINDGNISLGANGRMFGGSETGTQIAGGTITMNGSDGKAASLWFGTTTGANSISGGEINVTGVADIALGNSVNMTGGEVNVAITTGELTLSKLNDVPAGTKPTLNLAGGKFTTAGVLTLGQDVAVSLDGGTMAVTGGKVDAFPGNALTVNSGSLTVTNGQIFGNKGNTDPVPAPFYYNDGMNFTVNGGTVTLDSSTTTTDQTCIWAGQVNITDGKITLGGNTLNGPNDDLVNIAGYKGMNITGGEITLNPTSELIAGKTNGMQITGGTITMNGAPDAPDSAAGSAQIRFSHGDNRIGGDARIIVPAGKKGTLLTGDRLTMDGGTLEAEGTLALQVERHGKGGMYNPTSGTFTQTGGTIRVGDSGELALTDKTDADSKPFTANINDGATMQVTGNGKVTVASQATLHFASGSLLDVSAESASAPSGVIRAAGVGDAGTVTAANGAKLRITGAQAGDTYRVLDSGLTTSGVDPAAWTGDNLLTDSSMLNLRRIADGTFTSEVASAVATYPGLDEELGRILEQGYANRQIDGRHVNADAPGARFLSRATSRDYLGNDAEQAAVTMESAARMALIGAVPQMTLAANNAAGAAVTQRTSLAQPGGNALQSMAPDGSVSGASATDVARTGFALWIMPLYQSANGWGLEGGNFNLDYSGGLGGVAIGADYTFENAIRAGITFNIGGGYATGSGDFNETTNDMSFWGIGAYAGWTRNNFGLTADVNYTSTYNKLEQDLPASMAMGDLKSDVTAWAISAGLRGEYKFETSVLDITPHVGVRYTSLNTDEYDVKSGGTVLKGDGISQNIWTFPVGVAFSRQIETGNGWRVKPSLDLAVIPAAGDIEARGDVRFTGVSGTAELKTQTMDYISYMGQAGLEFGNDSVSFGVNYNLQTGVHSTSHGVFGTFRYEF